ncbi:MAG: TetR/AcrR family transcriptional regulator [Bacteroidales bacterium]|jgi:AcrR family transcriptional regulator|nr:TetR/AcrR family transcriptional regulator [Bacteroidales bacterium]
MNTNDNMEMRIREVAQQLFFKQGYAATSTIQIAKEVGCTQALVHYYYRTKENLFRQIFMEQIQAALRVIGQSLMSEDSFDKFIENAISMYFDTLIQNPRLPYFVLEELISNPERRKYLRENFVKNSTYAMFYLQFDARLKQEQQAGRISPIDPFDLMITIASLVVFTFISLPMYQDLLSRTDEQVHEFVLHRKEEVIRIVRKMLMP